LYINVIYSYIKTQIGLKYKNEYVCIYYFDQAKNLLDLINVCIENNWSKLLEMILENIQLSFEQKRHYRNKCNDELKKYFN